MDDIKAQIEKLRSEIQMLAASVQEAIDSFEPGEDDNESPWAEVHGYLSAADEALSDAVDNIPESE